jgi:hypothetical protein
MMDKGGRFGLFKLIAIVLTLQHASIRIDWAVLAVAEATREERVKHSGSSWLTINPSTGVYSN